MISIAGENIKIANIISTLKNQCRRQNDVHYPRRTTWSVILDNKNKKCQTDRTKNAHTHKLTHTNRHTHKQPVECGRRKNVN